MPFENKEAFSALTKPDTYLLYETRPNAASNTNIRFVLELSENIDGEVLSVAVNEAIKRYPYFAVRVAVEDGVYKLVPNDLPIVVTETKTPAAPLGSSEVNGHLNYLDYETDTIYFNVSHSITDASGYIPFIKSTLYQYLTRLHKEDFGTDGIRLPDDACPAAEFAFPTADTLPEADYTYHREPSMGYFPFNDYMQAMRNPSPENAGYYCIHMKQRELMQYIHANDASPATILSVFMFKALSGFFPAAELFSAGIACNFKNAVGCAGAYHSLSSALHVPYKRSYLDLPIDKLGTITRGAVMLQSQPENMVIHTKALLDHIAAVDARKTLAEKKEYCLKEGLFTKGCRDTYNVSYVGHTDFGDMNKYVRSMNTVLAGNLVLEINAVGNMFYITFNQVLKTDKYIRAFMRVLDEAGLRYSVSNYRTKNVPTVELPEE
ncbi:MAG: hypothetical protein Q4C53_07355 [Clostridia bacterium]|nr:hypothetical protein [Clostridia bacterium]